MQLVVPDNVTIDPLQRYLAGLKPLIKDIPTDVDVFYNNVLVACFIGDTVGKTGKLLASESRKKEDRWQGKVGYVIKVGPSAFLDEDGVNFHGCKVKVGDWVMFRSSDGFSFDYLPRDASTAVSCKMIGDADIKGVVSRADLIF